MIGVDEVARNLRRDVCSLKRILKDFLGLLRGGGDQYQLRRVKDPEFSPYLDRAMLRLWELGSPRDHSST